MIQNSLLDDSDIMKIHQTIHSNQKEVLLSTGDKVFVEIAANGCKKIAIGTTTFMEQNKLKNSPYGKRAREGEHITWGIRPSNSWLFITDNGIVK